MGPVLAFWIARRWCISLQRADQNRLLHGYETGVIMRSPEGAYAEKHLPISDDEAYTLTARDRDAVLPMPTEADENGVANRKVKLMRLRAQGCRSSGSATTSRSRPARSSRRPGTTPSTSWRCTRTGTSTSPAATTRATTSSTASAADGHQFDGRHSIEGDELRKH